MADELSDTADKVYKAMKDGGITGEDRMSTAERITNMVRLPKNKVMNALQELQAKGYVKRKVREKASGYYLLR